MAKQFSMDDVRRWPRNTRIGASGGLTISLDPQLHYPRRKIIDASNLVKQGKVISLAIPFDDKGPQTGSFGRFKPDPFHAPGWG